MGTPGLSIEVIVLPVTDVDRALRFYVDQVGFSLDVDYAPSDTFRVVQLTPPGSSCSVQIGKRLTDSPAGSLRNTYLVVTDLRTARKLLAFGIFLTAMFLSLKLPYWGFAWCVVRSCSIPSQSRRYH